MAKAVRFHKQGGPEVMQYDDVQVGDPDSGYSQLDESYVDPSESPSSEPGDGHDIPYDTGEKTPVPSPSAR